MNEHVPSLWESIKTVFSGKDKVHEHWHTPIENFQFSTADFYQMVENELKSRKVPQLQMSRELNHEGGLLSDKREYLRLRRERLVFVKGVGSW